MFHSDIASQVHLLSAMSI